jgi:hypothetical protein
MKPDQSIKKIALFLVVLLIFFWGFTALGFSHHILDHRQTSHHSEQHSSFSCAWMCAVSNFLSSTDQTLNLSFHPLVERIKPLFLFFIFHLTYSHLRPRSPPALNLQIR